MAHDTSTATLYGLMAEFDNPTALVDAANRARLQGFRQMDAYSPIPIEELNEALGLRRTRLPRLVLLGGILGGLGGFSLEYLGVDDRLSDECRRSAAQQLAAVHPRDVRDDCVGSGAHRVCEHVGAQQAADAVSPCLQRAGVRASVARSVLPVHRVDRSKVRLAGDAGVPAELASRRSD